MIRTDDDYPSRRGFLRNSAASAAVSGMSLARGTTWKSGPARRTIFFDFSHLSSASEHFLILGGAKHRLERVTAGHPALRAERQTNRFLAAIPDANITHVVQTTLNANAVYSSYVMTDPDSGTGQWSMSAMYLMPPISGYAHAYKLARQRVGPGQPLPLSAKRREYGIGPAESLQDLVDEQALLTPHDWAASLGNFHPECLSFEGNSAANIQVNHFLNQPEVARAAYALTQAGPARPENATLLENSSGWATLVPYLDADGNPYKSAEGNLKGYVLYDARWNSSIQKPIADLIATGAQGVKDDTTLGSDTTNHTSSAASNADLLGTIWTRRDGAAFVDQTAAGHHRAGDASYNFAIKNLAPQYNGYSVSSESAGGAKVTLNFSNWYVRYLALYARFYVSEGGAALSPQPLIFPDSGLDQADASYLGIIGPELTVLGIPITPGTSSVTFEFPSKAGYAEILASGLGYGSHYYPDTEALGIALTVIFNLSLPMLLLLFGLGLELNAVTKLVLNFLQAILKFIATTIVTGRVSVLSVFSGFWSAVVSNPVSTLVGLNAALAGFFAGEAFLDAIPLAGAILQAFGAVVVVATEAETALEVVLSPWSYLAGMTVTHDINLTIRPDPRHNQGQTFPTTAASYKVTAAFNGGTPHVQTTPISGATGNQLQATFASVPAGGTVVLTVAFYDSSNNLLANGSTGSVPNDAGPAHASGLQTSITITEFPAPVSASTQYQHQQKTILNASGDHVWQCAPAPSETTLSCSLEPGQLCGLQSISVNYKTGDVGYDWTSYSETSCSQSTGQLDQMASISTANGDQQGSYVKLPCAIAQGSKLIFNPVGDPNQNFYLDASNGQYLLRQVTLSPPSFSNPDGSPVWGQFNLPPDDIVFHPGGAALSINSESAKLECIKLPAAGVADTEASSLLGTLHAGQGSRPGLFSLPVAATVTAEGVVLILEENNNRIQAVDAFANPHPYFTNQPTKYFLQLDATNGYTYLDIAVEFTGLIYVLSQQNATYRLDIYTPDQSSTKPLTTTTGVNAGAVTVDYWRNVYTLNYEVLTLAGQLPNGVTEPSVSQWIPSAATCDATGRKRTRTGNGAKGMLRRRLFWNPGTALG